jgi:hypothetical protein
MGTGALTSGREAGTHLTLVPRVRMRGVIPPLPEYVFIAWCLPKHGDIFTLLGSQREGGKKARMKDEINKAEMLK